MRIKAGIWKQLSDKEKMDLLIHHVHHNPVKEAIKKTARKKQSA